jgi:peptidoglycan/LPS O-acetylase OafA/YrhL
MTTSEIPQAVDPHVSRIWIKPYYASFNGLRGIAVMMTLLHHYASFWHAKKLAAVTWTGVDLFFVLSGFLITGILVDSIETPHYFRDFYVRRALRIFPVFYTFFAILLLLTPVLGLIYTRWLITFPLYVGNLTLPFLLARVNPTMVLVMYHGHPVEVANIGHLWSLCIEEQFYLLWPSVIWFVRDRRKLMRICVVVSLLTLVGRFFLWKFFWHPLLIHWATYTRWDTLLIGAWFSLWLRQTTLSTLALRRIGNLMILVPALVFALGMWLFGRGWEVEQVLQSGFLCTFGYTLIALTCAGIMVRSLDESSPFSRVLRFGPMASLGIISYGFYFLQELPLPLLQRLAFWHPRFGFAMPFVAFALSLVGAKLSFKYLESPFLRLKSKLAPKAEGISPASVPTPSAS